MAPAWRSRAGRRQELPWFFAAAKRPVKKTAKKSSGVDFSDTGSADADGYRRGSFGIGENESYVIWGLVLARSPLARPPVAFMLFMH